jgi:hypothetical protein
MVDGGASDVKTGSATALCERLCWLSQAPTVLGVPARLPPLERLLIQSSSMPDPHSQRFGALRQRHDTQELSSERGFVTVIPPCAEP